MHRWLDIPGDPFVARVFAAIFLISIQMGVYILLLLIVRYYVKPISTGHRALGLIAGTILGIIAAAEGYTSAYTRLFNAEPSSVSIFLCCSVLANIALADFVFRLKS